MHQGFQPLLYTCSFSTYMLEILLNLKLLTVSTAVPSTTGLWILGFPFPVNLFLSLADIEFSGISIGLSFVHLSSDLSLPIFYKFTDGIGPVAGYTVRGIMKVEQGSEHTAWKFSNVHVYGRESVGTDSYFLRSVHED